MRALLCSSLMIIVLVAVSISPAAAQTPTVTVYFDQNYSSRVMDCPGPGVLDTLYVVAEDWSSYLTGIEFKVDLPPQMIWLGDLDLPPVHFGNTVTGVSMGFGVPQNAYQPLQIARILVLWDCTDCSITNAKLAVVPHPIFGFVRATRWPDYEYIYGEGGGSAVCQLVNLDIKPGSCPNPFNGKLWEWADQGKPQKGGVIPVALVGSATFDVHDVDLSSLRLEGVAPLSDGGGPKLNDVTAPIGDVEGCECAQYGPDGKKDISMKFNALELAAMIPEGTHGDQRTLTMTGTLMDGTPFSASDCVTIVGTPADKPAKFYEPVLGYPVPNPFNPSTRITFALPSSQHVSLVVYDVAGRQVEVLANDTYGEGEHMVQWNASKLPSGVYYYRLVTGDKVLVRKAILLK
jgi:hypothetical protein